MDAIMLILTIIGTVATVISTVIAIRAKNEAKTALNEVKIIAGKKSIQDSEVVINNTGGNSGVIAGVNTGEIKYDK